MDSVRRMPQSNCSPAFVDSHKITKQKPFDLALFKVKIARRPKDRGQPISLSERLKSTIMKVRVPSLAAESLGITECEQRNIKERNRDGYYF
jgi:hypothetical protein